MRINVYSEEMSDRIEIISKEIEGQKFTGLRIYLELPVTVMQCKCGALEPTTTLARMWSDKDPSYRGPLASDPCTLNIGQPHEFRPRQLSGPFMHHPGDDDSSAVTFWGKRDLRDVLKVALAKLDEHYGVTKLLMLALPEEDRQMVLLALAVLSLESPGFDDALNRIALRIDNHSHVRRSDDSERAELYDKFREVRRKDDHWDDAPLPEDEAIIAAHPVTTGDHDTHAEARRLVSARHSKSRLIDLVNWLLVKKNAAEKMVKERGGW